MEAETFGERVRRLRKFARLTQHAQCGGVPP